MERSAYPPFYRQPSLIDYRKILGSLTSTIFQEFPLPPPPQKISKGSHYDKSVLEEGIQMLVFYTAKYKNPSLRPI